jgi:hypothetical protein
VRPAFALVVAVVGVGCSRCGPRAQEVAAVDAGALARIERQSIELRTAAIQMFPEFRDVAVLSTRAQVSRVIPGLTDARRDASLLKLGWRRPEDGGTGWQLNRFHLEQPGPEVLELSLQLDVDALGLLYVAPSSLSSMEMAHYLPRDLPVGEETFEFEIHYVTSPDRAVLRIRQAAGLLLANGQWKLTRSPPGWSTPDAGDVDGGPLQLPETFSVEVESVDGMRIAWARVRGQTHVTYRWVTVRP